MRKILVIMAILGFAIISAVTHRAGATCPIEAEACKAEMSPTFTIQTFDHKAKQKTIEDMQKTDAFQDDYKAPYHPVLINTKSETVTTEEAAYNSNCQFGVCLPGAWGTLSDTVGY